MAVWASTKVGIVAPSKVTMPEEQTTPRTLTIAEKISVSARQSKSQRHRNAPWRPGSGVSESIGTLPGLLRRATRAYGNPERRSRASLKLGVKGNSPCAGGTMTRGLPAPLPRCSPVRAVWQARAISEDLTDSPCFHWSTPLLCTDTQIFCIRLTTSTLEHQRVAVPASSLKTSLLKRTI